MANWAAMKRQMRKERLNLRTAKKAEKKAGNHIIEYLCDFKVSSRDSHDVQYRALVLY